MLRLEAKLLRVEVIHSRPEPVTVYAQLRADCEAAVHALGQDRGWRVPRVRMYPSGIRATSPDAPAGSSADPVPAPRG